MYTVDGDALIATHYCSGQNQPMLRMNADKSSAERLAFDFVKVSGGKTDNYINGVNIHFGANGEVEEEWSTRAKGAQMRLFLNARD
jgi:hypothetical protein